VNACIPCSLVLKHVYEECLKETGSFYIQKALDITVGPLQN
jgi:hypothetical protein